MMNMDFYKRNRERLAAREDVPELERLLEALDSAAPPDAADTDAPGCPTLFAGDPRGERFALHSTRDPVREARAWVARHDPGQARAAVLAGIGLGYALEQILECAPKLELLCAVAPQVAHLAAAMRLRDLSWLADPRVRLFAGPFAWVAEPLSSLFEAMADQGGHIPILVHGPSLRAMTDEETAFREALSHIRNLLRPPQIHMAELGANNARANAQVMQDTRSTAELANTLAGRPIILVAPGPSLQKNIAALKLAAGHAPVLALDAAVRPLCAAGIMPDFVVTLDPQGVVSRFVPEPLPAPARLVWFAESQPDVVARFPSERRFLANASTAVDHAPNELFVSGSVLLPALDLCRIMGCDPIIFAGLDFAYGHGRSHVRGSPAGGRNTVTDRTCDGYFGLPARTIQAFYIYLRQAGEFIGRAMPGRRVWDATEGGAAIANTVPLPLVHALLRIIPEP